MPKIKDLGVKVIPQTMRPPECGNFTPCACTVITGCANFTIHQCIFHTTQTICGNFTLHCTCTITPIPCLGGTCGFSGDPWQQGELTGEQIRQLREQLQSQINALDEYAKTVGPKTSADIDAREKQLNDELAELKARRKNLK